MSQPQPGEKYRHYKSSGGSDYTYEVVGIALHTEIAGEKLVIYKSLYVEAEVQYFARPLSMRNEEVVYEGKSVTRFTKM